MDPSELPIPSTTAARAAVQIAQRHCSPALFDHGVRAYLWAVIYAHDREISFDSELLYLAALLHDIALTPTFDSLTVPFEVAGGEVAVVLAAGAGWPPDRQGRVREVVIRHMWDQVPLEDDPEGHLLEVTTGIDISGRNVNEIPLEWRNAVLEKYPRLTLGEEFTQCIQAQSLRKSFSAAASFVAAGAPQRIARNPLDTRPNEPSYAPRVNRPD